MKPFRSLAAAALAVVGLTGPALANCIPFAKFGSGPFFGGSIQVDRNTVLQLSLAPMWWEVSPPRTNFGSARVMPNSCFGGPESLNLNNVALVVTILQREPNAEVVNLNYCDFGGFENVSARVAAPPDFVGEIDTVPTPLPDAFGNPVDVSVRENPIRGGVEGKLVFEQPGGSIRTMVVAGQEFFAYEICIN